MPAVKILSSILSADFGHLANEVGKVTAAGVDGIHVDVMDGHFVPNLTFGPKAVQAIRKSTQLPLDVHLMIEQPERWIETYVEAGADLIHIHVETCVHLHRVIQQIRALHRGVGVSLNPATPLASLDHVLEEIDRVLIMSVNPGFGGQSFLPSMLTKIATLSQWIKKRNLRTQIEVDGGIHPANIASVVQAGAHIIVSGSDIFKTPDYASNVQALQQEAHQSFLQKGRNV